MFKCNRTNEVVTLSSTAGYTFYNPTLDEDLLMIETYLDVSDTAKQEAKGLDLSNLPKNVSHNTQLIQAVQSGSMQGVLSSIDNNTRPLEYCEAVLVQAFLTH